MHPNLAAPTHIHVRRFIARHTEWGWRRGQSREPETADAVAPHARTKHVAPNERPAQQHLIREGDESRNTIEQRGSKVSFSSCEGG